MHSCVSAHSRRSGCALDDGWWWVAGGEEGERTVVVLDRELAVRIIALGDDGTLRGEKV
jgi:hypothetical protein